MDGVCSAPLCACLVSVVAANAVGDVRITGGADASGHRYTWVVTNDGDSPITHVEFPHYRANLFFAPDGWNSDCTFLVNVGVPPQPGVCKAWVDSPVRGIARHRSAEFSMQVGTQGAVRGPGEVVLTTAGGQRVAVTGVELPQVETTSDKYVSLIALGILFAVLVLARVVRRSKTATAAGSGAASSRIDGS